MGLLEAAEPGLCVRPPGAEGLDGSLCLPDVLTLGDDGLCLRDGLPGALDGAVCGDEGFLLVGDALDAGPHLLFIRGRRLDDGAGLLDGCCRFLCCRSGCGERLCVGELRLYCGEPVALVGNVGPRGRCFLLLGLRLLGEFLSHGLAALRGGDGRLEGLCLFLCGGDFVVVLPELSFELCLRGDLLLEDGEALAGSGNLPALLAGPVLGKVFEPAIDVQPEEGRENFHAPVAAGLEE